MWFSGIVIVQCMFKTANCPMYCVRLSLSDCEIGHGLLSYNTLKKTRWVALKENA